MVAVVVVVVVVVGVGVGVVVVVGVAVGVVGVVGVAVVVAVAVGVAVAVVVCLTNYQPKRKLEMKKLALLILILPFVSFEAHALKSLGVVNCDSGPGVCRTVSAVEDFGIATISKKLKCDPNKGACSIVKGEEYIIRVDVYDHSVCKVFHYHVRGTAFNKPAMNHFAIFSQVSSTYKSTCDNHDHPCQGGGEPK